MDDTSSKDRVGDVLGLGNISSTTGLPADTNRRHESDARHRHHRMSEGADEVTPGPAAPARSSGATGIDMGAGGEGTDIEPE
jgi:hypothetical protein